jgi:hypothetical protein
MAPVLRTSIPNVGNPSTFYNVIRRGSRAPRSRQQPVALLAELLLGDASAAFAGDFLEPLWFGDADMPAR